MEIIPAIDIIEGACVRLSQGDYQQKKVYDQDPLQAAKRLEQAGCSRLHLVDLDGAREGRIINTRVLERISAYTNLVIDYGGGIKHRDDVKTAFSAGASMITGGSVAVKDPNQFLSWLDLYGSDRIILGADARDGRVSVSGWMEDSGLDVVEFILSFLKRGVRRVISTDIAQDGMLAGPSLNLYKRILDAVEQAGLAVELTASGGVSKIEDVAELKELGVSGVIIGKALYEGTISLEQLNPWMEE